MAETTMFSRAKATSSDNIRPLNLTSSSSSSSDGDEDFEKLYRMWHIIFSPPWPIPRPRLHALLTSIPGARSSHVIADHGFCLAFLEADNGETRGWIAAVGVMPSYRGRGLGSGLLERGVEGLRRGAEEGGGKLKSLGVGSRTPRFWHMIPSAAFPQETKDFFVKRGFHKEEGRSRDLYRDVRGDFVPPELMDKVTASRIEFRVWAPELEEECLAKQRVLFSWHRAYEVMAAYGQHSEVMVAVDPDTNAQVGWTLMCSPAAIMNGIFAFMPLAPSGPEKTGLIAAVGVDPAARGQGVGIAMLVRAIENMKERGVEGVFIDSVPIDGFYEKLGFETLWEYEEYAFKLE